MPQSSEIKAMQCPILIEDKRVRGLFTENYAEKLKI